MTDKHNKELSYWADLGISEEMIKDISLIKEEPDWMLDQRLNAIRHFNRMPMPEWGPDLSCLDLSDLHYYISPGAEKSDSWDDVPDDIKKTFEELGIPKDEKRYLSGSSAQMESEIIYSNLKKQWKEKGIIFEGMDDALKKYPEIIKENFGMVVPPNDNKFAALNTAAWSGGTFIYVPKGVHIDIPLQTYFRIDSKKMGQFERSLIIADEGSSVSYIEGCSAPVFSNASIHAAVVEIIAKNDAKVRYTTIQNWSNNIYNLVTKRAHAYKGASMEWLDGNMGSKITQKYPTVILKGTGAKADVLSIAYATKGQIQDTGAKMIHLAPKTQSRVVSKSICQNGGRSSYRGKVFIGENAVGSKSFVECNAYLLDENSRSDTYPLIVDQQNNANVHHEAKVGSISKDKLFYLMSRGFQEKDAIAMVILGFMESFTKELPMEYALELNRLIRLQLERSVG